MTEKLRRKGQGETERPICQICKKDLKRLYERDYIEHNGTFIPVGWGCRQCNYTQLD